MTKLYPYPWLTLDGTFEYRDVKDQPLIRSSYDYAEPFYGKYAVVGKKKKYGVIDTKGNTVVPLKYDALKHYYNGTFHIFAVKQEYNGWWRFWNWKLLPEYNLLSPSYRGPLLVARVPRAKWRLIAMPGKKQLARLYKDDSRSLMGTTQHWSPYWEPDRRLPRQLHFPFHDSELLYKNKLFHMTGKGVRRKNKHIFAKLEAHTYLKFKKNQYFRVDSAGRRLDGEVFTRENQVVFKTVEGSSVVVPAQRKHSHKVIQAPIFKDRTGRYFLYPNLNQPFPSLLSPHPQFGELKNIQMIAAHPVPGWFLIMASDSDTYERYSFLINEHGEWMEGLPPLKGLHWIAERGEMILDYKKKPQIVDTLFQLHDVPIKHISIIPSSPELYAGKCIETGRYGIFNINSRQWQIAPEYSYLQNEIAPGIIIYSKIIEAPRENAAKRELEGLLDIHKNKKLTPPLYDSIGPDGRVRLLENGVHIQFYLDPLTGEELRAT